MPWIESCWLLQTQRSSVSTSQAVKKLSCVQKSTYCPVAPKDKKHKMRERDDGDKKFTKIRSPV